METVWKYTLDIRRDTTVLELPEKSKFLKAKGRDQVDGTLWSPFVDLWFWVDAGSSLEDRTFEIYGTGHTIETPGDLYYLDTVFPMKDLVLHIFLRSLLKTSSE